MKPTSEVEAASGPAAASKPLKFYYLLIGTAALTILLLIPALGNNYYNHVVIQMMFFAYLGTAWNIMGGYTGQLSFGHAAFFGLGAYTSTLLLVNFGISPWVGMFVGGAVAFAVGAAVGSVGFRYGLRGVFFAFVTLSTAEIFRLLALLMVPVTNGAEGILIPWKGHDPLMFAFSVHKKYLHYYTIMIMAIVILLVAYLIKKTRFGYYLAAIRENEDAAEALGINGPKLKILAIGISAFFTALGGTFFAQYYQHFEPFEVFGPLRSFEIIFPVIIGGGGFVFGPSIGAFVLQFFEETSRQLIPPLLLGFHRILYGGIIVGMIIFLPTGLAGLFVVWKDRIVTKYKIKQ